MNNARTEANRRSFLAAASSLIAASAFAQQPSEEERDGTGPARTICAFTKPFNSLSFDQLADEMAELGFDGIEAPIRAGGHVEPADVEERLPQLVEALKQRGLEITVMASDINDPADPITERVLRTASTLGIQRYRMKYFRYDTGRDVMKQLADWQAQLIELAQMNHEFGIRAVYQNHAGNGYMGAALWDLAAALQEIDQADIAIAYDIRHATAEGGMSWPTTYRRVRPMIDTVYVKDFVWEAGKERPLNVPLGEGRVDPRFFQMLQQDQFAGPISLHEEYLDHRDPQLVPQHLAALKRDLATLRSWLR